MPFSSTMRDASATRRSRAWPRLILIAIAAVWIGTACWEANKPLPVGVKTDSAWYPVPAGNISFIADITAADAYGRPVVSQAIFDEVLKVVRSARRILVLDYFLFNDRGGAADASAAPLRAISGELRDALIEQRRVHPDLRVLLIVDPINRVYGGASSRDLVLLRAAGVDVTVTDLDQLRDPNFVYSSFRRLAIGWWSGDGRGEGWLPNPLDEGASPITFGAWAQLANFKANHRKVVIADDGHDSLVGVVGSANPHDASSAHSNVAVRITGPVLGPLLQSELAVARFSGWKGNFDPPAATTDEAARTGDTQDAEIAAGRMARVKVLTEGAIRSAVLEHVDATVKGDSIDIAMFYVADRNVVEALVAASQRGIAVRLILDPNKDAFGHAKSGIPNRPVASELVAASDGAIHVRWYRTHGEQFHTKLVMVYGPERLWFTLGSANLTRRNIGDYNLEANLAVEVARRAPLALQTLEYFETLWTNRALLGMEYTADFGVYADPAQSHYWLYRLMEGTGLSTF
jgi:phosphatidylserine/phosphatidylglycerophosphate/cardiolipin synthase-like enzyme